MNGTSTQRGKQTCRYVYFCLYMTVCVGEGEKEEELTNNKERKIREKE